MGDYEYKVTPAEMESLYAQLGSLGVGGPLAGNISAEDTGATEQGHGAMRSILDSIKDRNHDEQGHPDAG